MDTSGINYIIKSLVLLAIFCTCATLYGQHNSIHAGINTKNLRAILQKKRSSYQQGKVADYIPALSKMDPQAAALAIVNPGAELR